MDRRRRNERPLTANQRAHAEAGPVGSLEWGERSIGPRGAGQASHVVGPGIAGKAADPRRRDAAMAAAAVPIGAMGPYGRSSIGVDGRPYVVPLGLAGVAITAAANSAADRSLSLVIQILRHLFEADTQLHAGDEEDFWRFTGGSLSRYFNDPRARVTFDGTSLAGLGVLDVELAECARDHEIVVVQH